MKANAASSGEMAELLRAARIDSCGYTMLQYEHFTFLKIFQRDPEKEGGRHKHASRSSNGNKQEEERLQAQRHQVFDSLHRVKKCEKRGSEG